MTVAGRRKSLICSAILTGEEGSEGSEESQAKEREREASEQWRRGTSGARRERERACDQGLLVAARGRG